MPNGGFWRCKAYHHQISGLGSSRKAKSFRVSLTSSLRSRRQLCRRPDGKLLVMTPIDPIFLLIPILQAIKPVSICLEPLSPLPSRPCLWSSLPQNDGSAGLFQPLDDIFDEAAPKIVRSVNERTLNDDALAFPPISAEDMMSLTRYDCIIDALNRICDSQSARPSLVGRDRPHMMDERRYHPGAHCLPLL